MKEPVTIVDRDVLKILAVDTRMDILKELSKGSRMPSYLGKKLNKSDATIVEHLSKLEKAGLVKKVEVPGKKFVFYTLTEHGVGVVSTKTRRLVIILSTSILALIGGMMSFTGYMFTSQGPQVFVAREVAEVGTALPTAAPEAAETVSQALTLPQVLLPLSIILFVISIAGFGFYFYKKRRLG